MVGSGCPGRINGSIMTEMCLFEVSQLAPAPAQDTYPRYDGKERSYIPYEKPPYTASIPVDWLTDRRWWFRLAWLSLEEERYDGVDGQGPFKNRLLKKRESAQWVRICEFIPGSNWHEHRAVVKQTAAGHNRTSRLAQLVQISVTKAEFERAHILFPEIGNYRSLENA